MNARQKGGLATLAKYGADHYRKIGKQGGRPPKKNISQLLAERQQSPGASSNGKEEGWPPTSLVKLRALFFERYGNENKSQ